MGFGRQAVDAQRVGALSVTSGLRTVTDNMARVMQSINRLAGQQVLVGIPAGPPREDGEPITNAELGYIHEYGSPATNVPARPSLIPGIEDAQPQITDQLRAAAVAALNGTPAEVDTRLNRAGLIAVNSVKARISSNIAPALAPDTIKNRLRSRKTKSMRKNEKAYLDLIAGGSSPEDAQSAAGIIALVNTGEFRNSFTYVIRKK